MKKQILQHNMSRNISLLLLLLGTSLSATATEISKPHGELYGLWGYPNKEWTTEWKEVNAGGVKVGVYFGLEIGGTLAEVRFQGNGDLNYTSWPGTGGDLSFTETSGSAKMFIGFETKALWRLRYPGWSYDTLFGKVWLIPSVNREFPLPGLPNLDYALSDEADCDNYLLGDSVSLSDSFDDIDIIEVPIGYPNILSGNVGASLSSEVECTVEGLRLNTSDGTLTNGQTQTVNLSAADYTNTVSQTSEGSIALNLTPNITIGVTALFITYDFDPIALGTIPIEDLFPTEFTTSPRSIVFPNANTAQAITLPASEAVYSGATASATLNGTVNPGGLMSSAWFEWGTTTSYGNSAALENVGNGTNDVSKSYTLNGLTAGTTYHYRTVSSNSIGTVVGEDQIFGPLFLSLNGDNPLIITVDTPFIDPRAEVSVGNVEAPLAIAAADSHSLMLKADGTVLGWGDNNHGQISVPADASNVVAISAGLYHSLALVGDSNVVAWGIETVIPRYVGDFGQVIVPADLHQVVAIAAGDLHSLALKSDGMVVGWGCNTHDQTAIPDNLSNVVAIAAGDLHSLALNSDGMVVGWGHNDYGQASIPDGLTNVVAIAAGYDHSLALKANGTVTNWGWEDEIPASATNVVAIAAGDFHSLALKSDGSIIGWGYNGSGQVSIPISATNVVAIAASEYHSLALKADGSIMGWGSNSSGQLNIPPIFGGVGISETVDTSVPGTYTLTYSVTNAAGNISSATRTVMVQGVPVVATHSVWPALTIETNASFTVNGLVNPGGMPATAWFEWGVDTGYGHTSSAVNINGSEQLSISHTLSNMMIGVACHYRVVASNSVGIAYGVDLQFSPPYLTLIGDNPMVVQLGSAYTEPGFESTGYFPRGSGVIGTVDTSQIGSNTLRYWLGQEWSSYACISRTVVVASPPDVDTLIASGVLSVGTNASATLNGAVNPCALETDAWFEWGTTTNYGFSSELTSVGSGLTTEGASQSLTGLEAGVKYHYRAVASNAFGVAYGQDVPFSPLFFSLNGNSSISHPYGDVFTDPGYLVFDPTFDPIFDPLFDLRVPIQAIDAGTYNNLVLLTNGAVSGWGAEGSTEQPGEDNIVAIASGAWHSLALRADGSVVSWGPVSGMVSLDDANNGIAIAAGPTLVLVLQADGEVLAWDLINGRIEVPEGLSNVVAIAADGNQGSLSAHSLALKSDGTVVGWGNNDYGQVDVPAGVSNVVEIVTGERHSLALRADGSMVGWGDNTYGQSDMPAGFSNVVAMAAGDRFSLALKGDGSVVAWGLSNVGQTNVPPELNQVVAISAGAYHSLALKADGSIVAWGENGNGQTDVPMLYRTRNIIGVDGLVDPATPGSYTLTYSAMNGLGFVGTATRTVNVAALSPVFYSVDFSGNLFGAGITGPSGQVTVVEASTNLLSGSWVPIWTNTLGSEPLYFSDPQTNSLPARFYQIRFEP